jgi:hypothetical protein
MKVIIALVIFIAAIAGTWEYPALWANPFWYIIPIILIFAIINSFFLTMSFDSVWIVIAGNPMAGLGISLPLIFMLVFYFLGGNKFSQDLETHTLYNNVPISFSYKNINGTRTVEVKNLSSDFIDHGKAICSFDTNPNDESQVKQVEFNVDINSSILPGYPSWGQIADKYQIERYNLNPDTVSCKLVYVTFKSNKQFKIKIDYKFDKTINAMTFKIKNNGQETISNLKLVCYVKADDGPDYLKEVTLMSKHDRSFWSSNPIKPGKTKEFFDVSGSLEFYNCQVANAKTS